MADNTPKKLRNQIMYQVFVRNFSEEGTFKKVEEELDRIKALGTDIVWLMPIHPIGKAQGYSRFAVRHKRLPRSKPRVRHARRFYFVHKCRSRQGHEVHYRCGL